MPRDLAKRLIKASVISTVVLFVHLSAANAASVTNRDAQDHTVTIVEGGSQTDHILKKDAVLEGVCMKGCTIRIDGDGVNPYELDGSEVTAIEGGDLYAEGQGPLASPGSGSASQPSTPAPK